MYILHNYYRSSTSFRVRIALNLKGMEYTQKSYHLRQGEQRTDAYLALNDQGLVPTLELDDGTCLSQSMAILEYLDAVHPDSALIPHDPVEAAYVRALCFRVACDIHPLNNLRVLGYLADPLGHDPDEVATWFRHWMNIEFASLEHTLSTDPRTGRFCVGDTPTLADVCLIPQVINGKRFDAGVEAYPTIKRIFEEAMKLPAFEQAAPTNQPDAE